MVTHRLDCLIDDAALLDHLNILIYEGGGEILGHPAWTTQITQIEGAAMFNIKKGDDMAVLCTVAWLREDADDLSQRLWAKAKAIGYKNLAPIPKRLPWLTVMLADGLNLATSDEASWIGDFAPSLAAAILKRNGVW